MVQLASDASVFAAFVRCTASHGDDAWTLEYPGLGKLGRTLSSRRVTR